MNLSPKRTALLLIVALGAVLAGCSSETPEASSIPWNQPADWEGQIPGMNNSGSQVH
jgi:nitrous oxide reductase accessory protein NosL